MSYNENGSTPHRLTELEKILREASKDKDPARLAGRVLDITQLYFDKLLPDKSSSDYKPKPSDKETMETLLSIGAKLIPTVTKKRDMDLKGIRQGLRDISKGLLTRDINRGPNSRYLDQMLGEDKERFVEAFYATAKKALSGVKIDTIVYIASGGLEPALLIKDIKPNAELVPLRYSNYKRGDYTPMPPGYMTESDLSKKIHGKRVIIIDDDIDSGRSMIVTLQRISKFNPSKLYCGAVMGLKPEEYISVWSESKRDLLSSHIETLASSDTVKFNLDHKSDRRRPYIYSVKQESIPAEAELVNPWDAIED